MAGVCEGLSGSEAARLNAMDVRALRSWLLVFNADGSDCLVNTRPPGRSSKLSPNKTLYGAHCGRAVRYPRITCPITRWLAARSRGWITNLTSFSR
ncbi:helix-turn-helix domain-containing protein [Salinisphaera sp. SWV1]|uniref:helix-turn-helix domain-containing protein n=1 Tax=Salinisphaera sp. SWV1 TaxID=3454139 RepID=UPI003F824818